LKGKSDPATSDRKIVLRKLIQQIRISKLASKKRSIESGSKNQTEKNNPANLDQNKNKVKTIWQFDETTGFS
jgi:hypothetical protein